MSRKALIDEITTDDIVSIGGIDYQVIRIGVNSFTEPLLYLSSTSPTDGERIHIQIIGNKRMRLTLLT